MRIKPYVVLHSSDRELEKGFDWAKRQALDWVSLDCPVGDYYEAALPGRAAFCMRDVSHQCTGAEVLGLSRLNYNMFQKFAEAIDERLDYCSYWEIDRWNRPCPVDYESETNFWYNLPANFDVLHACFRMYLWTGNRDYLSGAAFDRFYQLTMEQYIKKWDRDGDGLPDRVPSDGRRGLVSYDESPYACGEYKVGGDLLAAMARGHLSFAEISRILGRHEYAAIYGKRAQALMHKLHVEWYDEKSGHYARGMLMDGSLLYTDDQFRGSYLLYWDLLPTPERANQIADAYAQNMHSMQVEGYSHAPELLWRYGKPADALIAFRHLTSPDMPRRVYPEASYCAVGAAATGLMGIEPDARERRIRTMSGLCDVQWAEMEHVPVLSRTFSIRHEGNAKSTALLESGESVTWRAAFPGHCDLFINGEAADKTIRAHCPYSAKPISYVDIELYPGQEISVDAH